MHSPDRAGTATRRPQPGTARTRFSDSARSAPLGDVVERDPGGPVGERASPSSAASLLALQRRAGNAAVTRWIEARRVGQPGDTGADTHPGVRDIAGRVVVHRVPAPTHTAEAAVDVPADRPATGTVSARGGNHHVDASGTRNRTAQIDSSGGVYDHPGAPGHQEWADAGPRFVGIVPMKTGATPAATLAAVQQLVDHYESAGRTASGHKPVSLVVGLNHPVDGEHGTDGHLDEHLGALTALRSSIPVRVVGAGWRSGGTRREDVPFGGIRDHLVGRRDVADFAHGGEAAFDDDAPVTFAHFGDSDVRSMSTPGGRGLFDAAADHLAGDAPPKLVSGGYRLGDERGTTPDSQRDLAVRKALGEAAGGINYFPEPNTFYRLDPYLSGDGVLDRDHSFGKGFDNEGKALRDSVLANRGDGDARWVDGLSVRTDAARIGRAAGESADQSMTSPGTWRDRMNEFLERHDVYRQGQRLRAIGEAVLAGTVTEALKQNCRAVQEAIDASPAGPEVRAQFQKAVNGTLAASMRAPHTT